MNESGIFPVEYRVLIKPEKIEDTDPTLRGAKEAGLYIPEEESEREQMAQMKGVLVAVGGNAFNDWNEKIPAVGDRVMFAKYAGFNAEGQDGEKYRLCNDKDVSAILAR